MFLNQLQLHYKNDATMRDSCEEWQDWGVDEFITNLEALWPQNPEPTDMTFLQAVKAWKFCYDLSDESIVGIHFLNYSRFTVAMTSERRATMHEQSSCYMRSCTFQIRPTGKFASQKSKPK